MSYYDALPKTAEENIASLERRLADSKNAVANRDRTIRELTLKVAELTTKVARCEVLEQSRNELAYCLTHLAVAVDNEHPDEDAYWARVETAMKAARTAVERYRRRGVVATEATGAA